MPNAEFLLKDVSEFTTPEAREEYIASIEQFIVECRAAANRGEELVSDATYDTAIELLKSVRPDSFIFDTTWSEDDSTAVLDENLDSQLIRHPMLSIQTIKDLGSKEFLAFSERLADICAAQDASIELHASMKLNGHGIRLVYNNGQFVKAHTRGRSSNGRDITRAISLIVPNQIAALAHYGIVELRGELLLPFANLATARTFKADIKSAFTGVSAMIRESASDAEYKLLRVVCYNIFADGLSFESLFDKCKFLEQCGFETPLYKRYRVSAHLVNMSQVATTIVEEFAACEPNYAYFTDGVVLAIDDTSLMAQQGTDRSTGNGNIALKVGFWKQDMYSAVVDHIDWKEGRSKLTPVAVVEPTLTANGASVTNVPLYAPIHILRLEAYPGYTIHFRFGGEAGVVPCFPDGRLVTDV